MAEGRRTSGQAAPRRFLADPGEFGRAPEARWIPLEADEDRNEWLGAYWHHIAVCMLRDTLPGQVAEEIAKRSGNSLSYVRRQVNGDYRVPLEEIVWWAIWFKDVSLLVSTDSSESIRPPT